MGRGTWMAALSLALLASAAVNVFLYRKADHVYRELLAVRLDPTSSSHFARLNAAVPEKAPHEVRVVLLGDSRIEHWTEPPSLAGVRYVNRGSGGETTAQIVQRIDRDVLALGADLCVIECGVNDLKAVALFPEQADEIAHGCARNIRAAAELLAKRGVRVVVLTILPSGPVSLARRPYWSGAVDAAIVAVNAELRGITSPGVRVVDCDPSFRAGERLVGEFVEDQLHLNAAGYAELGRLVGPVLEEEASRLRR